MTFSRFLRTQFSEANPMAAGMQVDFEERDADRSRYTIGHNIHPASEMEDEMGGMGGPPVDGAMIPGGAGGGMGGMPGEMPPGGGLPTDQELQPIEPGMAPPPGQEGMPPQQPMMQGYAPRDDFDLLLDHILTERGPGDYGPNPGGYGDYDWSSPQSRGAYPGQLPAVGFPQGYDDSRYNWSSPQSRGGYPASAYPVGRGEYPGSTRDLNNQELARIGNEYGFAPGTDPGAEAPARGGGRNRGGGGGGGGGARGGGAAAGPVKTGTFRAAGADETLGLGMKGDRVKAAQQALIKAGHDVGPHGADGLWGPDTQKAWDASEAAKKATQTQTPAADAAGTPNVAAPVVGAGAGLSRIPGATAGAGAGGTAAGAGAGAGGAPTSGRPGVPSFDERLEKQAQAQTAKTGVRPNWAGPAPAAAAAEPAGWGSRALNALGTGARAIGRVSPYLAGAVGGGEEYAKTGSLPRALVKGVGQGLGAAGGAIGGAFAGAPFGGPIGAVPAGMAGGMAGAHFGGKAADTANDWMFPVNKPAAATTPPPKGAATPTTTTAAPTTTTAPAPGTTGRPAGPVPAPTGMKGTASGTEAPPPAQQAAPAAQQAAPAPAQPATTEPLNQSMTWSDHNALFEADLQIRRRKLQNL